MDQGNPEGTSQSMTTRTRRILASTGAATSAVLATTGKKTKAVLATTGAATSAVLATTGATTKAVLATVSDAHWWAGIGNFLRPLGRGGMGGDNRGDADPGDVEKNGIETRVCPAFYEACYTEPLLSKVCYIDLYFIVLK